MAYASHTATETTLIKGQGFVERLVKAFADYREYSRTYNELNSLSDRELQDLGISRVSIRDVAYGAVYGDEIMLATPAGRQVSRARVPATNPPLPS